MAGPAKKNRRRRWLLLVLALPVVFVAGWLFINQVVKSKLKAQLAEAGLGSTEVGSVTVGLNGFSASDINIKSDSAVFVIDRLEITQSFVDLARGVQPMNMVEVTGCSADIDSKHLGGESTFSFDDLDLKNLQLPTKGILLSDCRFRLFDSDGAVQVKARDAKVGSDDSGFTVSGDLEFLDGEVEVNGSLNRSSKDLQFEFVGSQLHLIDQQWQKWPGIGPAVLKHLGADSVFDVTGRVKGNLKTGVSYTSDVVTKDARLYIPKFDLPIAIRSANVDITDGLVTYKEVIAAMGDKDVVHATGTTTIDGLPCRSKFEGDFSSVNVADLRKLVKEIPVEVVGYATGHVVGSVDVNEALETTLRISANGDTDQASYGQIDAASGNVDVQIQPLLLSEDGETIDLQGAVTVKAETEKQNVDGVLGTFDLQALDEQFEFEMLGDGSVSLVIPLNSAADLATWTLDVNSTASRGSVSGIELQNLKIHAFLDHGQLKFDPTTAELAANPDSGIEASVQWPLSNGAAQSTTNTGQVKVSAKQIPPAEATKFFARQMNNAGVDYSLKSEISSLSDSDLAGELNFNASIEIPAADDRPVDSWDVKATLDHSSVSYQTQQLRNLAGKLTIDDGLLSVFDLQGNIKDGGNISARANLDLAAGELKEMQFDLKSFPALWLANVIIWSDDSGKFAQRTGLNRENVAKQIGGTFDASIRTDSEHKDDLLWNLTSPTLEIHGQQFASVTARGHYDTAFDIQQIKADLPESGRAQLDGDWMAGTDDGTFKLVWSNAALAPLLRQQFSLPDSFSAKSNGDLDITFRDSVPEYSGTVELLQPTALGGSFADHSFEISTTDGRVHFRNSANVNEEVSLEGSFETSHPFDFRVRGRTNSMPLSVNVNDRLAGEATSTFELSGQALPLKIRSSGTAEFTRLRFENTPLSDIQSSWDLDTSKDRQKLELIGFGGKAILNPENQNIADLAFDVEKIELIELAAFRKLPVELDGQVSGSATVRNWKIPGSRSVELAGDSSLVRVGNARLSGVSGKVSYAENTQELNYSLESQLLDGKLECSGEAQLKSLSNPSETTFPVAVRLSNARLNRVAESVAESPASFLKKIQGRVSVGMDWEVIPGEYPKGIGTISLEDVNYRNRLVSRKIGSDVSLNAGVLRLKKINADLQQGEIAGQATIPLTGSASGSYELNVRDFSLPRMLQVLQDNPIEANGLVNARISGRTGRTITGSGTLGVSRAGLFGDSRQSLKVPVRFSVKPIQQSARIELPKSRVRAFRGTIDGAALLEIGSQVSFESNLSFSNVDSQSLLKSLTGYQKPGTGKLSGKLNLSARNYRSENDLTGAFRGELKQSNALSLPLLDQMSRFLGNTTSLRSDRFDSDSINLTLSKGRIDVKQFRLQSALASILVTGSAWLNGKLDLEIAARVERLDQPTLIDQLAGSPIARAVGPQAAFFAQAAEFLSERIVFVDVSGTTTRPVYRLSPGKQLKEEAIRYFLRGSQILPNANLLNN